MKTTIVNIHRKPHDIYIGRGTPWGNKYKIGKDGDRFTVVRKYEEDIIKHLNQFPPFFLMMKDKLEGKILGCHCKPYLCHGDVIIHILENYFLCSECQSFNHKDRAFGGPSNLCGECHDKL